MDLLEQIYKKYCHGFANEISLQRKIKLLKSNRLLFSSNKPEGHEELGEVVDDLHGAEDGEAGEESHGAPDQTQLGVDCHLHVSLYFIIGRRVKVDLDHLQGGELYGGVWGAWWLGWV